MQRQKSKNSYLVKIIVIGDSGVGKTNLITRFCQNYYKDTYVATIGVDFKIKNIVIGDKIFKMQIWDTAGQERFKNITPTYYKSAAGILLVFSINDPKSFENIERWMTQIDCNAPEDVSKVLVGTKIDLQEERKIDSQQGRKLAAKHGISYLETSAKTGFQVNEAFQLIGKQIIKVQDEKGEVPGFGNKNKNIIRKSVVEVQGRSCGC